MASFLRRRHVCPMCKATYHMTARCVRQAFLFGKDPATGRDNSHRKRWLVVRHAQMAQLFALEVEFRAELSNHLHAIARTRPEIIAGLTDYQVAYRWLTATRLAKCMDDSLPTPDPRKLQALLEDQQKLAVVRKRLCDISWYMAILLENLARRVNHEEKTKGRVWDGPFRSREVVGRASLLICGVYVDLNTIRAGEAESVETAEFTSIYTRLQSVDYPPYSADRPDAYLAELTEQPERKADEPWGYKSRSGRRASDLGCLPITLEDYVKLLKWTLAMLQRGERQTIPKHLGAMLERLKLNPDAWLETVERYDRRFCRVVGSASEIRQVAQRMGVRHLKGVTAAQSAFL